MELDFNRIKEEYEYSDNDDDLVRELKEDFFNTLTEGERRILMLYMECFTYVGVARYLNVSPPTARKVIEEIKDKLR